MKIKKSNGFLILAIFSAIACVCQIIVLIRYLRRQPDDLIGILLFVVTIIAFALVSIGFLIQCQKEKRDDNIMVYKTNHK